jgi:predicted dehydrogenase
MIIKIVGAGSIGLRHSSNLRKLGVNVEVIQYRHYSNDSLNNCDGVVVATATDVRLPIIRDAVDRNLPMFIEKPIAFRNDDLEEILRITQFNAERSCVGFMMRYHPAFQYLASVDLSKVYSFNFNIGQDVTKWRSNWEFSKSYAAKQCGGGVLLDLCHEIDMASVLFGDLKINSVTSLDHENYKEIDFFSLINLTVGTKVAGSIAMDYLSPLLHRSVNIYSLTTNYSFDFAMQKYIISDKNGGRLINFEFDRNDMYLSIMSDWLKLVKGSGETSAIMPRLDLVLSSARIACEAWKARHFLGFIDKEL